MDEMEILKLFKEKNFGEDEDAFEIYQTVLEMIGVKLDAKIYRTLEDFAGTKKYDDDFIPYYSDETISKANPEQLKCMLATIMREISYSVGEFKHGTQWALKEFHKKYAPKIIDEIIKKTQYKFN